MSSYQPPAEEDEDGGRELYKDTGSNDNGGTKIRKSIREDIPWKIVGTLGGGLLGLIGIGYAVAEGVSGAEVANYDEIDFILDGGLESFDSGKEVAYDILSDPQTVEYSLKALDSGSDLL